MQTNLPQRTHLPNGQDLLFALAKGLANLLFCLLVVEHDLTELLPEGEEASAFRALLALRCC